MTSRLRRLQTTEGPHATGPHALRAALLVLALGVAWFGAELLLLAVENREGPVGSLLDRAPRLVPGQLAVFVAVASVVALLALRVRSKLHLMWLGTALASFGFLGARVGEGMLRQSTLAAAILGVALAALAVGGATGLLAWGASRAPARWRSAAHVAGIAGWSLFFISFLRRAGPAFGLGKTGLLGWLPFLELRDPAIGALAAGVTFLAASSRKGGLVTAGAAAVVATAVGLHLAGSPSARAGNGGAEPARPDVLVLLVDTFRHDHLGANGGPPELTPTLDALARESIRFSRAYAPSNLTRRSMPGILASVPWRVVREPLPPRADTLAELLRAEGYATYGISTNPNVSRQFGYEQGFDTFLDPSSTHDFLIVNPLQIFGVLAPATSYGAGLLTSGLYYRPIEEVRRRGSQMLREAPRPAFLYLHTMDPHGPYLPPHRLLPPEFELRHFVSYYEFNDMSGKGVLQSESFRPELENLRQRYAGEVRRSDAEIEELVRELREAGRWEETLVWLLSDHGEAFGEHDTAGHGGPNMTQTLIRVPLLMKPPRSWDIEPKVVDVPVSAYDVVPTTLSLLGAEPSPSAWGHDLSAIVRNEGTPPRYRDRTVFSFNVAGGVAIWACVRGDWKLNVREPPEGERRLELFDLRRDPGENRNVAGEHPERVRELLADLGEWRERESGFEPTEEGSPGSGVDDRTREQLRELGYVE